MRYLRVVIIALTLPGGIRGRLPHCELSIPRTRETADEDTTAGSGSKEDRDAEAFSSVCCFFLVGSFCTSSQVLRRRAPSVSERERRFGFSSFCLSISVLGTMMRGRREGGRERERATECKQFQSDWSTSYGQRNDEMMRGIESDDTTK